MTIRWIEQTCNNLSPWNASTTLKSLNNEMTQIKIVHSTVPLNYLASRYSIQTVWFPQWPIPSQLFNCNKIRKEVKVSTANRLTGRNNHLFLTFTLFYRYCSTLEWTSAASISHLPSLERGWMFKMFPFFKSSMFPPTTRFVWSKYQITQSKTRE